MLIICSILCSIIVTGIIVTVLYVMDPSPTDDPQVRGGQM